jgi:hypothetical protein
MLLPLLAAVAKSASLHSVFNNKLLYRVQPACFVFSREKWKLTACALTRAAVFMGPVRVEQQQQYRFNELIREYSKKCVCT